MEKDRDRGIHWYPVCLSLRKFFF